MKLQGYKMTDMVFLRKLSFEVFVSKGAQNEVFQVLGKINGWNLCFA